MSKKSYMLITACIVAAALAAVTVATMLSRSNASTKQVSAEEAVIAEEEQAKVTQVVVEGNDLVEVELEEVDTDSDRVVTTEELPSDLDVSQRNEYLQSLINYDGISIDITEEGFNLSDDFVWSDDTYWFDEDPEGFARYSYLYTPDYGDEAFKSQASDSLNQWVGANTDITYCMTAALDTTVAEDTVTWYVVFREYPDVLVKVVYTISYDSYSYEQLF